MPIENNICREHSGCLARLDNAEKENAEQWQKMVRINQRMEKIEDRVGSILTRINIILGGIAVSCVLLAINAVVKFIGQ